MKASELKIAENCPKNYISLIKEYWVRNDEKFKIKVIELQKRYNFSKKSQVTNLVRSYSQYLIYSECPKCNKDYLYRECQIRQDYPVNDFRREICRDCILTEQKEKWEEEEQKQNQIRKEVKAATPPDICDKLSIDEIICLQTIVFHHGCIPNILAEYNNTNIINQLLAKGIIAEIDWVSYEYADNLPVLLDNYFKQRITDDGFSVNLLKNTSYSQRAPKYRCKIKFTKQIVLEPGVEYLCGLWGNSNGTASFVIKPVNSRTVIYCSDNNEELVYIQNPE